MYRRMFINLTHYLRDRSAGALDGRTAWRRASLPVAAAFWAVYFAGAVTSAQASPAGEPTAGSTDAAQANPSGPAKQEEGTPPPAAELAEIRITGSRVITDSSNSPTPLTVVATEQLQATTPSDIPDALNKLPVFQGSQQPRRSGDASVNLAANILNLRGFGVQRTLVLLDGHRATPSDSAGTVDVDTLPQMLVSRVDIITGGASAVYGSDAVTGVVNFVLDKKFTGLKVEANGGISTYGDAGSYKLGVAVGHDLFDGRAHFVASAEHFSQNGIRNFDRPYGQQVWVLTGNGTAAHPYTSTENTRRADSTFGGLIDSCTAPCPALGQQFIANGVLAPYFAGATTGTGNQNAGGDGAYNLYGSATSNVLTSQVFARFDYDIANSTDAYVQTSFADAYNDGWHFPVKLSPGSSQASNFFKNNPFLPPAVQTQLGNNGLSNASNLFGMGTYITDTGPEGLTGARADNKTYSVLTGISGTLMDRFHWDLYYNHGENRARVQSTNNSNYQRQFAALDAVIAPNGTVQCYAATQAATAAEYAGCVPLNAFGPTAISQQAFQWFTGTTTFVMTNVLDDTGASISGNVADGWAGPITVALSAEGRHNKYYVDSNANPNATVNCTGLRICNPSLPLWAQPVLGSVHAQNDVWETAVETEIPLLRDLPLTRKFDVNAAARYTHYSTSGAVDTWKLGFADHVTDAFLLRGTASVDIRAPTLNDLFQPSQSAVQGFVDLHTGSSNTVFAYTRGNPNLLPEKAHTYTLGAVWQPEFASGLSTSIDFYKIRMSNAIGAVAASDPTVQSLCEASGGSSPYCALYLRPLPFGDHTAANFPTQVYNLSLNTALLEIEGYDFEVDYHTALARIVNSLAGNFSLRLLANYQPINEAQAFPGAPMIRGAVPRGHATAMMGYEVSNWSLALQDTWYSGYNQTAVAGQIWATPEVGSFNSIDINIGRLFPIGDSALSVYLTVQNVLDRKPPVVPNAGSVGLYFPVPPGEDILGRYYTFGFRAKL